jgi:hypothetical protein
MALAPAPLPEQATKPPSAQSREAWRAEMSRPKKGCFTASYPSTEWQEVPCGPPSRYPNQPRRRGLKGARPAIVGGMLTNDFSAQSSGTISSAEGSFDSITGASGESGDAAGTANVYANVFELQINTQMFPNPPACNGVVGCEGWQQFLFSQTQGPPPGPGQQSVVPGTTAVVFMEYWLLGYGTCPTVEPMPGLHWISDGTDCYFNGPSTYVPPQTIADLQGLIMTATTSAGGQDTVKLATTSGNLFAMGSDGVLKLAQFWNAVEFNVFGDCCSSQANFNIGTTIVVRTRLDDGTTNAPSCVSESFTGESNSRTLVNPCSPIGGTSPAIVFTESSACIPPGDLCAPGSTCCDRRECRNNFCVAITRCDGRPVPPESCSAGWRCCGTDGWACGACR